MWLFLYVFSIEKSCITNSDPLCMRYREPWTHGVYCVWHKSTSDPNQTPWEVSLGIMTGFRKFFSSHSLSAGLPACSVVCMLTSQVQKFSKSAAYRRHKSAPWVCRTEQNSPKILNLLKSLKKFLLTLSTAWISSSFCCCLDQVLGSPKRNGMLTTDQHSYNCSNNSVDIFHNEKSHLINFAIRRKEKYNLFV